MSGGVRRREIFNRGDAELVTDMEKVGNQMTERNPSESIAEYLVRLKEMGFLFHGSAHPERIEKLEPRKANDLKGNEWNSDMAVYASGEPVWSVIFALYKGNDPWATSTQFSTEKGFRVTARILKKYQDDLANETGRVYILPPETFESQHQHSRQYKSRQAVTPIGAVEVILQDYYDMGGKIEWT